MPGYAPREMERASINPRNKFCVLHADHKRELPLVKALLFPALSHALTEPQSVLSGIHKGSVCDTMSLLVTTLTH